MNHSSSAGRVGPVLRRKRKPSGMFGEESRDALAVEACRDKSYCLRNETLAGGCRFVDVEQQSSGVGDEQR